VNHARLVDLLLVRLNREEEKKKVIDLLVSELGMTVEEATEKTDNSPSILSEGIDMEQGRILQDRMYPFVDLLPKQYTGNHNEASDDIDDDPIQTTPMIDTPESSYTSEELPSDIMDSSDIYHDQSRQYDADDDDSLIITSAAEEMLSVERCHICGRTPTDNHKLVPCRTCDELTCSDCFNRTHHVCEKCASEGRVIDRPLDSVPKAPGSVKQEERISPQSPTERKSVSSKYGVLSKLSPLLIGIIAVVLVVAAFFIIDPMNLFVSSDDSEEYVEIISIDTAAVTDPDSLASDSTAAADTALVEPDSSLASADSLKINGYISLRNISLPDSMAIPEGYVLPRMLTTSPVRNIDILTDSLQYIAELLGPLTAFYSIELDGVSLISTEDNIDILIMSILHPEPAERRTALLGELGTLLDSTMVDQMILYYRENQYYEPNLFSFTADSFSILSISGSPTFLQRRQSLIPETTELVTGALFEWMTDLN